MICFRELSIIVCIQLFKTYLHGDSHRSQSKSFISNPNVTSFMQDATTMLVSHYHACISYEVEHFACKSWLEYNRIIVNIDVYQIICVFLRTERFS